MFTSDITKEDWELLFTQYDQQSTTALTQQTVPVAPIVPVDPEAIGQYTLVHGKLFLAMLKRLKDLQAVIPFDFSEGGLGITLSYLNVYVVRIFIPKAKFAAWTNRQPSVSFFLNNVQVSNLHNSVDSDQSVTFVRHDKTDVITCYATNGAQHPKKFPLTNNVNQADDDFDLDAVEYDWSATVNPKDLQSCINTAINIGGQTQGLTWTDGVIGWTTYSDANRSMVLCETKLDTVDASGSFAAEAGVSVTFLKNAVGFVSCARQVRLAVNAAHVRLVLNVQLTSETAPSTITILIARLST